MGTYRLNVHDIDLINRMTRPLGGYIDIGKRRFNGEMGPNEPFMDIVLYHCKYPSCSGCMGLDGVKVTLEPSMDFDIREPILQTRKRRKNRATFKAEPEQDFAGG